MKIIDLLNKIASGEIDRNNKYQFSRDDYCTINAFFERYIIDEENLNLEIIEEEKEIPDELYCLFTIDYNDDLHEVIKKTNINFKNISEKLDKIIDYLKGKGDE